MLRRTFAVLALATLPLPALSEGWSLTGSDAEFRRIDDRATFEKVIRQGTLNRFGIRLKVDPAGRIGGRAFGRDVSGNWEWRDGYFCRDMDWGSTDLGPNCQAVAVSGNVVRFTSDRGQGQFADLRLE